MRLETANRVAWEFDISLDWLVGLTDDPTPARERSGGPDSYIIYWIPGSPMAEAEIRPLP